MVVAPRLCQRALNADGPLAAVVQSGKNRNLKLPENQAQICRLLKPDYIRAANTQPNSIVGHSYRRRDILTAQVFATYYHILRLWKL